MKLKRLLLVFIALSFLGASTVIASEGFEWYRAKKIKVNVNGDNSSIEGMIVNIDRESSKKMLPVEEIGELLQAVVKWDDETQTIQISKPNAHIYLLTPQGSSEGMFAKVYHEETSVISILVHLDSVTEAHALRIEIVDPTDTVVYRSGGKTKEPDAGMIWHRTPKNITMKFRHLGMYTVKVYLQPDENSEFFLISEKVFESISK